MTVFKPVCFYVGGSAYQIRHNQVLSLHMYVKLQILGSRVKVLLDS